MKFVREQCSLSSFFPIARGLRARLYVCMYVYIYMYVYTYVYIYIEREAGERDIFTSLVSFECFDSCMRLPRSENKFVREHAFASL